MKMIDELVKEYQRAFNITPEQWTGKTRNSEFVFAKRQFAKQARTLGYTWREIAKACGNRNYTAMIKLLQGEGWREKNILKAKEKKHANNKRRI